MSTKIDKSFVSEIDLFLNVLRKEVPETDSQHQERQKYERINQYRDSPKETTSSDEFWEKF